MSNCSTLSDVQVSERFFQTHPYINRLWYNPGLVLHDFYKAEWQWIKAVFDEHAPAVVDLLRKRQYKEAEKLVQSLGFERWHNPDGSQEIAQYGKSLSRFDVKFSDYIDVDNM